MSEPRPAFAHPPVYEALAAHHDRQGFDCGELSLNQFLQRQARQNAERHLGVTHVAVPTAGSPRILGYYTLMVRSVVREALPSSKKLPPGEIGVVLLARLAVSTQAQGVGLGRQMLLRAITQTERAAREIGIHALLIHALDEKALRWYQSLDYGFETLTTDPLHLCLPLVTIQQLMEERTGNP